MTKDELKVKEVLLWAQHENRVLPGKAICYMTGIAGTPALRDVIHNMRATHGEHICSSYRGYWYGKTDQEVIQSSMQMEKLAISIFRAARGMRRGLVDQIPMEEYLVGEDNLHE